MGPNDTQKTASSRRLLFWIVIGVIVLNIVLFLKFGLSNRRGEPGRESPAVEPTTNGNSNP
jgi:hypothetical protein